MNQRPVYIVLCGLPGSGKTTLAENLRSKIVNRRGVAYLSTDNFISARARNLGLTYDEAFSTTIGEAQKTIDEFREMIVDMRWDAIHDQTNLTPKSRKKRLAGLPDDYLKVCLFVTVDEAVRQERLSRRVGKTIPAAVDRSMQESWVPPALSEGFDIVAPGYLAEMVLANYLIGVVNQTVVWQGLTILKESEYA